MRRLNAADAPAVSNIQSPVTLMCLSHLRWNFVWQRPQHLLSRATSDYEVLFVEEPVFQPQAKPHMDWRVDSSGVHVGVPVLPEGSTPSVVTLLQRKLIDRTMEVLNRRD